MAWHFVDTHGREGRVRKDLSVAYLGHKDIPRVIERCATELGVEPPATDEAMQALMIRVYIDGAVQKVERSDGDPELLQ